VLPGIDFSTIRFAEPEYLWLLVAPGILLLGWVWQVSRWREDTHRLLARRRAPVRQRFAPMGGLLAWLLVVLAAALALVGVARPQASVSLMRTAGVDMIVLQDGSASMHVRDVAPDRWQRSMKFVRVLAESLQWNNRDRIALALFAHIAAPQVRLTTDPNTFFFFLDHLTRQPPFPLQDETTWDTNIELGIYWGIRLIDRDEQLRGRSPNGKVFVLISDGQAWSGEIARALKLARARDVPVFVVGVGTPTGGFIPEAPVLNGRPVPAGTMSPIRAIVDRVSLLNIATAGGGQYYELDRDSDRQIATAIISTARRRAGSVGVQESFEDLHWYCLFAAACLVFASVFFLRERAELWLHAFATGAALVTVWTLTR
jgi:Ca-activated chloride channel family protein